LASGYANILAAGGNDDFYKFELVDNALKCSKMVTFRRGADGTPVPFELSENSDGTRRCLHLFPAFNDLVAPGSDCCYVIDELDRSLHTNLVKQLLASYLETRNPDTRSQLVLTNHDIEQMDQDVLRRDEIWIAERDPSLDATRLSSLDEFILKGEKIRRDRILPKLYLEGRVGGVPNIESYAGLFDYICNENEQR
jgi:AAA15 family ATPase/GTPase